MGEAIISRTLENNDVEVVQETGISTTNVMSQKAVTDKLNNKVDKVEGKGLSSEDFTAEDKEKLDNAVLTTAVVQGTGTSTTNIMSQKAVTDKLNNKVDKVEGKGLSSEDFTAEDKEKLDNAVPTTAVVQGTGTSTTNIMSQKAVTDKLNEKMDISQGYVRRRQYVPEAVDGTKNGWFLALYGENNFQFENYSCLLAVTQIHSGSGNQTSGIISLNVRITDYVMSIADWRIVCGNLPADKFRLVCSSYTNFYVYANTSDPWDKYMFEVLSESRENISIYSPIFKFNSSSDPISGDPGGTTLSNDRQVIFDMIYPVGSIYTSVNSTNPQNLFGGTWISWGTGRVPIGINTGDSDFNTVEKTGGSKSHEHLLDGTGAAMIGSDYGSAASLAYAATNVGVKTGTMYTVQGTQVTKQAQRAHNTSLTGWTNGTKTLPPYITCYMWKRTA